MGQDRCAVLASPRPDQSTRLECCWSMGWAQRKGSALTKLYRLVLRQRTSELGRTSPRDGGALPTDEAVGAGTSSPPDQALSRGSPGRTSSSKRGDSSSPSVSPSNERRESTPTTTYDKVNAHRTKTWGPSMTGGGPLQLLCPSTHRGHGRLWQRLGSRRTEGAYRP